MPAPNPHPSDVPAHLRGAISPERWALICASDDPDDQEDVRISRWVASLRDQEDQADA
jgi:hypothetical protein